MDAVDTRIVEILAVDGRASFSRIGREVGLSTNAAAARVRRLEENGTILGYRAVLAREEPDPMAGIEVFIEEVLPILREKEAELARARGTELNTDLLPVAPGVSAEEAARAGFDTLPADHPAKAGVAA